MANFDRELDWNDEITDESGSYEPLPEGDYRFTVAKIERARSQGKGKLPPCNMAKVTITVHGAEDDREITENLLLHTSVEWKLSQFFLSIGLKKHDEPLRMNWMGAVGKSGNCRVTQRDFQRRDGGIGVVNEIARFYAYDEFVDVVQPAQPTQPQYAAPAQYAQPQYNQPVQPAYQQPTAGGWQAGTF